MNKTLPQADWGDTAFDEPLAPALNNVDNDDLSKQERERYRQDTRQRKFLALWVVWATSVWLGVVLLIVILQGCNCLKLQASVVNVLLATTTANVLGLAYIVLNGLFGNGRKN